MFKRILVPLDGSKLAECVIPYVEELAKGCQTEEVVILRVCETPTVPADYPDATQRRSWDEHVKKATTEAQKQCGIYLGDVEKQLGQAGLKVKSESALGSAVDSIVDYADNNEIDLIIMASHGRSGPSKWVYGSVAEKVLRATCVPIMMIRAPGCVPRI